MYLYQKFSLILTYFFAFRGNFFKIKKNRPMASNLKKLGSQVVRKEYGEKESRIQLMLALRPRGPRDLFAQLPTQLFFRDFREIFLVCSALFCNILCLYGIKTQKNLLFVKKICPKSAKMVKNRCFSKNASKRVFFQKNLCFRHPLKSAKISRLLKTGF